ncbi:pentatricopeptide repeat-containing protein At4g15720-like [Pyrus x bretschneideri]|uniref:pentatricopeptide repeat-containing protein At4g15720-like n=1 Tax=Pyrus x bretschneideri TaxID=225117 RepID=UPI00202F035A|nr:pentatricopeptide repeat-containing protein At4g15720-like [Pyrus x bretschneideri]
MSGSEELALQAGRWMKCLNQTLCPGPRSGCVDTGQPGMALWLFWKMPECTVLPNEFTFATVINECSILANLRTGKRVHGPVELLCFRSNLVVFSSLVDMYGSATISIMLSGFLIRWAVGMLFLGLQLSIAYSLIGEWENAHGLRSEMRRTRVQKEPGRNRFEVKDSTYVVDAGDVSSCARGSEVVALLRKLEGKMKQRGRSLWMWRSRPRRKL